MRDTFGRAFGAGAGLVMGVTWGVAVVCLVAQLADGVVEEYEEYVRHRSQARATDDGNEEPGVGDIQQPG